MGMDVYGKAPTAEVGDYFRATIWWWHPLADYCTERHPDITAGCTYWHSNDGDGLDATHARMLADALRADLREGVVKAHKEQRDAYLAALPPEKCHLCDGTGARTDDLGKKRGFDKPGGCNGCGGRGEMPNFATSYGFDEDTVREFADFLAACGGFEIC